MKLVSKAHAKQGFDKGNTDALRLFAAAQRDAWFDNAISHADWIWEVMELQTEFGAADVWLCHRKGSVLEDHKIAGDPSKIKGISEERRRFFLLQRPAAEMETNHIFR